MGSGSSSEGAVRAMMQVFFDLGEKQASVTAGVSTRSGIMRLTVEIRIRLGMKA